VAIAGFLEEEGWIYALCLSAGSLVVNNSGFKAIYAEFFPFPCVKTRKSARLLHFSRTHEQKNQPLSLE
jgi:hypothetical protein